MFEDFIGLIQSSSLLHYLWMLTKNSKETLTLGNLRIKCKLDLILTLLYKEETNSLGDSISNISDDQTKVGVDLVSEFTDVDLL